MVMAAAGASAQATRLQEISALLRSAESVRVADLANRFGVSEMTVRRDLDELVGWGIARRVRGGAVAVGPLPVSFVERDQSQARSKSRIAQKLLRLLPPIGTVALDASTTVNRMAAGIEGSRDLVIVTNSIDTFRVLQGRTGLAVHLTGGEAEARTGSLVGPAAVRGASDFVFDLFVCSAAGLDARIGSSEVTLSDAEVKQAFARASARTLLAVDHTKLGRRARARLFSFDDLEMIVTDLDPSDSQLDPYRDHVRLL